MEGMALTRAQCGPLTDYPSLRAIGGTMERLFDPGTREQDGRTSFVWRRWRYFGRQCSIKITLGHDAQLNASLVFSANLTVPAPKMVQYQSTHIMDADTERDEPGKGVHIQHPPGQVVLASS